MRILLLLVLFAVPAAAQERDTLELELVLDPRESAPFEGEMILATIRGVYRETITNEDLKLRQMTDFDWTRLGQDDWSDQRIDGRTSRVFERRIALYPRKAGSLEILPIAHELEIIGADGRRETVIVRSDPVQVEVRETPAGAGEAWFPVRELELSDSWDADAARLEDGQSVRRRVVLRALGATPEMMPQQPPMREPWLITFTPPEERDFQVTSEGPVTTLVWTWTLRPITGEPGVIPSVTIPYFDTAGRAARTVQIPAAPIGYASFSDNSAKGWRRDVGVGPIHVVFALASCLVVVALALRGRLATAGHLGRLRRRMRRRRDLRRLRSYAKRGEVARFRVLAARLLRDGAAPPPSVPDPALGPVDAILFGGRDAPRAETLGSVLPEVRRALDGRAAELRPDRARAVR